MAKKIKPPSQRPGHRSYDEASSFDPNDRRLVAVHEAGHAVAAIVLGLPLRSVDVRRRKLPDGRVSVGFTDCPIHSDRRDLAALMPAMIQVMAGPLAEMRMDPRGTGAEAFDHDRDAAYRFAAIALCETTPGEGGRHVIPTDEIERNAGRIDEALDEAIHKADALVEERWEAILEVGRLLVERKALDAAEVGRLVERRTVHARS